jgi:hypothetical protein
MRTKKITIFLILTMSFIMTSQLAKAQFPIDSTSGEVRYSGVVELTGLTKETIFNKAKLWITSSLKSSDNMTNLNDASQEKLIGTGTVDIDSLRLPFLTKSYAIAKINFKFIVQIKDGRLKYSIENIILFYKDYNVIETGLNPIKPDNNWTKNMTRKFSVSAYERVNGKIESIISNFINKMKEKDGGDW